MKGLQAKLITWLEDHPTVCILTMAGLVLFLMAMVL